MRVIVDPTPTNPKHALTKSDVRRVLSVLPPEWTQPIEVVRLSNHLHSHPSAEYSFVSHRLTIRSRGRAVSDVIRDIITAVVLYYSMNHPTPLWRLADSQRKRLNREVEPLLADALHAIERSAEQDHSS